MDKLNTFQTQRNFVFKPYEIFNAFADPHLLAKWWGPNGFSNAFEVFEFKKNGDWKFLMTGPDGSRFPNHCIFLEIDENKQIVIQHSNQPHFTLTISLTPNGDGTTLLWTQSFEDSNIAKAMEQIVIKANEENLDRLQLILSGVL